MSLRIGISLVLVTVLALPLALQGAAVRAADDNGAPSFAGRWTVVADPGQAGGSPSAFFGGRDFTVTQDDKKLAIARTVPAEASQYPGAKSTFNLDGSESKNSTLIGGQTIELISTATWDGPKLVIVTKYSAQGMAVQQTDTWSLDKSGNLKVDQQRTQAGRPSAGSWTYKKN